MEAQRDRSPARRTPSVAASSSRGHGRQPRNGRSLAFVVVGKRDEHAGRPERKHGDSGSRDDRRPGKYFARIAVALVAARGEVRRADDAQADAVARPVAGEPVADPPCRRSSNVVLLMCCQPSVRPTTTRRSCPEISDGVRPSRRQTGHAARTVARGNPHVAQPVAAETGGAKRAQQIRLPELRLPRRRALRTPRRRLTADRADRRRPARRSTESRCARRTTRCRTPTRWRRSASAPGRLSPAPRGSVAGVAVADDLTVRLVAQIEAVGAMAIAIAERDRCGWRSPAPRAPPAGFRAPPRRPARGRCRFRAAGSGPRSRRRAGQSRCAARSAGARSLCRALPAEDLDRPPPRGRERRPRRRRTDPLPTERSSPHVTSRNAETPSQMRGRLFDQLMIVLEQRQRHVRPRPRERLDRPRIDRRVVQPLKHERRLRERRVERIVPEAVFVEREVQHPLVVVRVVEERQPAETPPLVDAFRRQQMVAFLREHHRRSQQHQPVDARAEGRPPRGSPGCRPGSIR